MNTQIIIWTTTPWTIPANRALAYNENLKYVIIKIEDQSDFKDKKIVVAEDLLKSILENKIININNNGNHKRAFTYIDDIIEAIKRLIEIPAQANTEWDPNSPLPNSSSSPWVIYNIGGSDPIDLMDFITMLEQKTKITANKRFLPIQPGDVLITDADCSDLEKTINFSPKTSLERGVTNFIEWYRDYYKI